MLGWCNRYFALQERGSSLRNEILGGATTFIAMAYIVVVNPAILEKAGIESGPGTVATILAAVFGCLLMGLYANQPIAVAPYMGENAFLAFGLMHILADYPEEHAVRLRLGAVFVSGVAFLVLTLLGLRTWLARAISSSLKHSFAVGIGLFLLLLGLQLTGIVQAGTSAVPLKLGDFSERTTQLALAGFVLIALLLLWRVQGAILLGIVVTALAGFLLGLVEPPAHFVALPWDDAYRLDRIALQLDILGVLNWSFLPFLLTLFLISFLDTLATLLALGAGDNHGGESGDAALRDMHRPMIVDAFACMFSAVVGTSTSGAYIESATGIREGARTGLAAGVTGILFALCLFLLPLVQPLQKMTFAYGPALMIVGMLMFSSVKHLDVDDYTELVPALATIAMMVFTFNIANGLTVGLILHPLLKLLTGRWREIHLGAFLLAAMCLAYFLVGVPH